ncbi:MAG: Xaa-Pro peptidase family protein [Ardenticatenaceae bacterium]|nr:Xaa-Pro peptidase family protein [Ardenticatenaceae bacterium]
MSVASNLPFSIGEYEERRDRLRRQMELTGVDALLVSGAENLYYLSGLSMNWGPPQYLIVPRDGPPRLLIYVTEEYNAEHFNWIEDWTSYRPGADPLQVVRALLAGLDLANGKIGIQKNRVSAEEFERLQELLPRATLVDSAGVVERLRMIKSPAEIEYMRQAARAVEAAMRAGVAAIEEGKSENELAAAVYQAAILAGSEHMVNTNFIVAGERSVIPHASWNGKRIERGDIVFFEISCRVQGYTVPLLRTAVLGQPDEHVERAAQAVTLALRRTIAAMHPGVTSGEVQRVCEKAFEETNYLPYFQHRAGYTIGLQWPETYAMSLQPDDPSPLQPGMVFHLVPHLEFHDRKYSIACGEVVLITEDGRETLTNFERQVVVV